MEEEIGQIGERLKGLREALNISEEEIAKLCDITVEHYKKIEAGKADPSVYRLSKIARHYGVDINALLFGDEPKMSSYFLTRKGEGIAVERNKSYSYQSLACGFRGRNVEPFLTEVKPLSDNANHNKNSHNGQEFNYILEGRLEITIAQKKLTLSPGDSIYFDASQPHCMRALDNKRVVFLAVII